MGEFMQTNLIIVEGIPGSGKSTTAAMIAEELQKNGKKVICVDEGATLKRMRPAPQGRGYRIRKRSNHVTLFVDSKSTNGDQN